LQLLAGRVVFVDLQLAGKRQSDRQGLIGCQKIIVFVE
jgi:hypothetical protein